MSTQTINCSSIVFRTSNRRCLSIFNSVKITISLTIDRTLLNSKTERSRLGTTHISHSQSVSSHRSYNRRNTRNHTSLRIKIQSSRKRRRYTYNILSSFNHRHNRLNSSVGDCSNFTRTNHNRSRFRRIAIIHRFTKSTIITQTCDTTRIQRRTSNRRSTS